MGMDRKIACSTEQCPPWNTIIAACAKKGLSLTMRMIDGELAFPGEEPSESWRELRVSVTNGMISIRRESDGISLVVWGNADAQLQRDWTELADAIESCVSS